jgi:hypothetical protein
MKRTLAAAMMTAMLVGPSYSQFNVGGQGGATPARQLELQREAERQQTEKQYNDAMKRLKQQPAAETKNDPWAGVRPAPEANTKR